MTEILDIRKLQKKNPYKDPLLVEEISQNDKPQSRFKFEEDQLSPLKKSLTSLIYENKQAVLITNEKDKQKKNTYSVRISYDDMTYTEKDKSKENIFQLDFKSGEIRLNKNSIQKHMFHVFMARITTLISDIGQKKVAYFDE